MKKLIKSGLGISLALLMGNTWAATNQAVNSAGGGVTLTDSGLVTVTSTALQLVKQVWVAGTCMASQPAQAACNTSATTINVPAGTAIKFLIYVQNSTGVALSDVRFLDQLDDSATGFAYTAASMKTDVTQNGTALASAIYTAAIAGTAQTDAVDVGGSNYASITDTVASPAPLDKLTVGAVAGQVNAVLNVNANTTFAIVFDATKL